MDNELKALEALFKLGIFGSLLDPEKMKTPDMDKFKAQAEAKRDEARKNAHDFMLRNAERQAKSAKALYDAFVKVGFSEAQAFDLLKATFILD